MKNEFTVTFEDDLVQVRADGAKDFDFSEKVWTEVVRVCEANGCFDVLGIANTTVPIEVMEGYDHARLFEELGIDQKYRIAWVELNPEATDVVAFVETVLVNRGLPGKLFETADDAKKWLRER